MKHLATVLILDALQRKSLALVRALGAEGHRILTAETTFFSICRLSRYADRSFVCPPPDKFPERFARWLHEVITRERVDAVLPSDDLTTDVLTRYAAEFEGQTGLLVPPRRSFEAMRDKSLSACWFKKAGVPHPRTFAVKRLRDVPSAARELGFPLAIKPRVTSGSRGLRFVRRADDIERAYLEVHLYHPWPILQEYITTGPKYHACLMYDRSHRLAARYVQRELRQYPVSGGPSTAQESVNRPDLIEMLEPLFELLPWTGPLHADIMEDGRTGRPYVLEVNPRYWQSLHVAQRAGVNFARMNLALALGQEAERLTPARPGIRGRALVPFDILAYLTDPRRNEWDPPFFSRYGPTMRDDLLSWSDPLPTAGFCLAIARYLFDQAMWRAVLRLDCR